MSIKIEVEHEGFTYCIETGDHRIIFYKNDVDEWMGETEHIKVFTIEGDTPNPVGLYRKMTKAFIDLIKLDRGKYYMFSVTDEKRANLYERIGRQVKGYTFQRADKWFYLYREEKDAF